MHVVFAVQMCFHRIGGSDGTGTAGALCAAYLVDRDW